MKVDQRWECFRDPSQPEYGNVPFWWWGGDRPSEERITAQLETPSERGVLPLDRRLQTAVGQERLVVPFRPLGRRVADERHS